MLNEVFSEVIIALACIANLVYGVLNIRNSFSARANLSRMGRIVTFVLGTAGVLVGGGFIGFILWHVYVI